MSSKKGHDDHMAKFGRALFYFYTDGTIASLHWF